MNDLLQAAIIGLLLTGAVLFIFGLHEAGRKNDGNFAAYVLLLLFLDFTLLAYALKGAFT